MADASVEQRVIDFVCREVPPPRPNITPETTLDDLRMVWEDAEELLVRYFAAFAVDCSAFRLEDHVSLPRPLFSRRRNAPPVRPLSLRMLADAAERGRWPPRG